MFLHLSLGLEIKTSLDVILEDLSFSEPPVVDQRILGQFYFYTLFFALPLKSQYIRE